MELSIYACIFPEFPLEDMLDYVKGLGITSVEMPAGAYMGKQYCNPGMLLRDRLKLKAFHESFCKRGMHINCLSVHGNPVHPRKEIRETHRQDIRDCIDLAARLGISHILTFSGVPGDSDSSTVPNWPVSPCPDEQQEVLLWQWENKLIPYWKETADYARQKGVQIALEIHTGMSVHTPFTLLKLRECAGDNIGANIDPSHMWWQGIDPEGAIRILGEAGAIYHFHAKDAAFDRYNTDMYGLTDTKPFHEGDKRSWIFRGAGRGHSLDVWERMVEALRMQAYKGPVSIEYEDSGISFEEGLRETVRNLSVLLEKGEYNERF